jgi:3-oxoacyl-[acyl-carrier protein] reductase
MEEPRGLAGRAAIVTGASAGLGAGIARELAARGVRVLMCSRSPEKLVAAAEAITASMRARGRSRESPPAGAHAAPGDPAASNHHRAATPNDPGPAATAWHPPIAVPGDVTAADTAPHLVRAAQEHFGRLDILVCNAGGPPPGDFADTGDDAWRAGFELILLSAIRSVRAALPLLRASGAGRIVITTSISGIKPVRRLLVSNALRPAVMGLVRHLAGELAPDGILVNAVAPGFFDTERSREVQAAIAEQRGVALADVQRETAARIPLARQGEPPELGRLIAFLVSPENTYLTGQTLVIDGGLLVGG